MKNSFLPNLFVLGAAKCGTTTIHQYLSQLPDVCMSQPKEPFFFEAYYEKGLRFYKENYFKHWNGESIIGEARHRNLLLPFVPKRIYEVNPSAKLLVIVRNPAERAYSHWYHNYSRHSEYLSFDKAIIEDVKRIEKGMDCSTKEEISKHIKGLPRSAPGKVKGLGLYRTYVDSGYYYQQIQRYLNFYKRNNLKVVLFEELVGNPDRVMEDIIRYIELPIDSFRVKTSNRNAHIEFPKELETTSYRLYRSFDIILNKVRGISEGKALSPYTYYKIKYKHVLHWLRDHYKKHNLELQEFINKDLASWQGNCF